MVTFNVYRSTASGAYVEGVCFASDDKPVLGIANGSILYEVDTSDGSTKKYIYNQAGMSWVEVEDDSGGGGGGGSTAPEPLIVTVTYNDQTWMDEADKTFGEILEAYQNGANVVFDLTASFNNRSGDKSSVISVLASIMQSSGSGGGGDIYVGNSNGSFQMTATSDDENPWYSYD